MATSPELLLISAVLRTQDHVTPAAKGITADLFHSHFSEWQWMEDYITKHRRSPTRAAFLSKFPRVALKKVDDVGHFIDEVKHSHARFSLVTMIKDIGEGLKQEDDPMKLLRLAHTESLVIQSQIEGESHTYDVMEDWEETYEEIKRRMERADTYGQSGIPLGFDTLDSNTGGAQAGDFWIVAARLGQGKTWTLTRMACAALWQDFRVQYFSLEQSRHQIAMRTHTFMSSKFGKDTFKALDLMMGKNFDLLGYKAFLRDMKNHTTGKLFINDSSRGRVSPLTIAAQIERNKPDIVFLDYLTLMDQDGDDWKAVAKLSAGMKMIAQKYEIPVVVAAQINRAGIGREPPGPEHLSQADAIGQDADAVVTLKQMSPHVVKMRLAKFRHGADGYTWWNRFTPNTGEFEEISGDEARDIMDMDIDDDLD